VFEGQTFKRKFFKRKLFPKTLKRLWNHVALNNHLIMLKYYPSQSCSKKVKVSHKIIDCAYKRRSKLQTWLNKQKYATTYRKLKNN